MLLRRHQDRVYRLAVRMCHNAADAEEVCQETFSLAYRAIGSFNGDSRFTTWIYRIAMNEVLMRRRSAARRPVQSLELVTLDADGAALGLVGSEPTEGADELLHAKVLTERVLAALAELDEGQRGALVLRDPRGALRGGGG